MRCVAHHDRYFSLKYFELFLVFEGGSSYFPLYIRFSQWFCCVLPDYDYVFIALFRYSVLSWHDILTSYTTSVTFYHEWRVYTCIWLTNIIWKSYIWRWRHSSISTIIHWIGCTILLDGGHQGYSTNYYINGNTQSKGWTWWFTYVLKRKKKE